MNDIAIQRLHVIQHAHKYSVGRTSYHERRGKLLKLREYLLAHVDEACLATDQDLGKPRSETIIGEILVLINEIQYAVKHLKVWMGPHRQPTGLVALGTSSHIQYEAKGQVLIMSPWNYPINLALKPLISAIAAGCVAIIKPSELTPASSSFVGKLVADLFEEQEVAVVTGDVSVSEKLLELPFDHIFFTGSTQVGKIVMKAASAHLSSVTLELGGKSPSIVDASCDLPTTARLICWGKFFNAGQTCIAPDYIIVHESIHRAFLKEMEKAIHHMYPNSTFTSEPREFSRIVNRKHFDRLTGYIADARAKGGQVTVGGSWDEKQLSISPTLIDQAKDTMLLMQEEIFGPILPVLTYRNEEEVLAMIRAKDKPLALYIHAKNREFIDTMLKGTSSGNALVNELLMQFSSPNTPFGGVNQSGIGKANGFFGFKEFSNAKGVMKRRYGSLSFLYPPISPRLSRLLEKAIRWL
ncbi:aldehyde dehydrogenase (NAD+) [Dyadobacter jejuensis]|uniref:Aldehyde dehydrogenase n=1 Tax=Dyadobacter jejuensis TaxID=1082580 RepID=A0A316ANA9_9BACT|nr:aldehyde dehydrogenase family protein [Dyadobacter jejuensis]PWJ59036.1 aldehyde dehydrogenase (NAD+) [Dyadobacter jejuensis]